MLAAPTEVGKRDKALHIRVHFVSKDIGRKRKSICCKTAVNSFLSLPMRYARYDKTAPIFIVPTVTALSDFSMTVVTVMTVVTLELHTYIYLRSSVNVSQVSLRKTKRAGIIRTEQCSDIVMIPTHYSRIHRRVDG